MSLVWTRRRWYHQRPLESNGDDDTKVFREMKHTFVGVLFRVVIRFLPGRWFRDDSTRSSRYTDKFTFSSVTPFYWTGFSTMKKGSETRFSGPQPFTHQMDRSVWFGTEQSMVFLSQRSKSLPPHHHWCVVFPKASIGISTHDPTLLPYSNRTQKQHSTLEYTQRHCLVYPCPCRPSLRPGRMQSIVTTMNRTQSWSNIRHLHGRNPKFSTVRSTGVDGDLAEDRSCV